MHCHVWAHATGQTRIMHDCTRLANGGMAGHAWLANLHSRIMWSSRSILAGAGWWHVCDDMLQQHGRDRRLSLVVSRERRGAPMCVWLSLGQLARPSCSTPHESSSCSATEHYAAHIAPRHTAHAPHTVAAHWLGVGGFCFICAGWQAVAQPQVQAGVGRAWCRGGCAGRGSGEVGSLAACVMIGGACVIFGCDTTQARRTSNVFLSVLSALLSVAVVTTRRLRL